jgi:hypothetical protein
MWKRNGDVEEREVRVGTIAHALARWGESGVRVREKLTWRGGSGAVHWHQPNGAGRKPFFPLVLCGVETAIILICVTDIQLFDNLPVIGRSSRCMKKTYFG